MKKCPLSFRLSKYTFLLAFTIIIITLWYRGVQYVNPTSIAPPPKKTDIFFHSRDKQVSTSHTLSLFSCLLHLFYPLIFNFPFICPLSSLSMKFSPFHISLPCFTIRRYSLEGGGVSTGISQYLYPPLLSLNHFPGGKASATSLSYQQNRMCFLSKREILSSLLTQGREF
jgi:hypothetical protein